MLFNKQGKPVELSHKATDEQRAEVREVLIPSRNYDKFFQLKERARVKGVQ